MPRGEHRPSILLSREENEQVFGLIGPKCQSLATAVVQLFTTEGPGHSEWKKMDTGVLCLVKDNARRSYFFRIYCLYRKIMIWEHEVYLQIEYKSPRPYLHTFEAEEYMTAFNFANEDEAKILRNILIERIEMRKQRRQERRQRSMMAVRANSGVVNNTPRHNGVTAPPLAPPPAPAPAPLAAPLTPKPSFTSGYTLKGTNKRPKGRKLTKADIGVPQGFKHVSHIGWSPATGFDVEALPDDDEMRSFFMKAGVSESQLQDQETRQFIYDFIHTNGGIDAVKKELHETKKPSKAAGYSPASAAPPVPSRSPAPTVPASQPPLPPSRAPPPPPARAVPPPPAAPRNPPPRPPQPPSSAPPSVPPPPPPPGAPPPPPPPPPAAAAPPAPPPPPAPPAPPPPDNTAAPASDARAALMESIRSGNKMLKPVEPSATAVPKSDDSRNNLLSEIRQGTQLRSVALREPKAEVPRSMPDGLAGALAKALDERSRVMHSSDSESDTTSDGEWDD